MAPVGLRQGFRALIEREMAHAAQARPAGAIIIKNNAVTDPAMIRTLYRRRRPACRSTSSSAASAACGPGVPGVSERIRVRSIVGRFLEHSRIYYFENGGEPEVYIGSADLMERNLDRRVEVLCPVRDPEIRQHLHDTVLTTVCADTDRAWTCARMARTCGNRCRQRARQSTRRRCCWRTTRRRTEVREGGARRGGASRRRERQGRAPRGGRTCGP